MQGSVLLAVSATVKCCCLQVLWHNAIIKLLPCVEVLSSVDSVWSNKTVILNIWPCRLSIVSLLICLSQQTDAEKLSEVSVGHKITVSCWEAKLCLLHRISTNSFNQQHNTLDHRHATSQTTVVTLLMAVKQQMREVCCSTARS